MIKFMRMTLSAALLAGLPLSGLSAEERILSTLEREQLRKEIREYLLDEPEVIMEAVRILEQRQVMEGAAKEKDLIAQYGDQIFNDGVSYVGGNPEGSITLVEFLDYRCGYCKRAHDEIAKLVDTDGDIKLIVKEFPILGPDSLLSARAAIATLNTQGGEAYKRMNDALMKFGGKINDKMLDRIASGANVDAAKMRAGMDDPKVDEIIAANRKLAQALDISGTPTFILPAKFIKGYLPYESMVEAVSLARRVKNDG